MVVRGPMRLRSYGAIIRARQRQRVVVEKEVEALKAMVCL